MATNLLRGSLLKRWFSRLPLAMYSTSRTSLSSLQYPSSLTRLGWFWWLAKLQLLETSLINSSHMKIRNKNRSCLLPNCMAMQFLGPLHQPYFQHQHKGEATPTRERLHHQYHRFPNEIISPLLVFGKIISSHQDSLSMVQVANKIGPLLQLGEDRF